MAKNSYGRPLIVDYRADASAKLLDRVQFIDKQSQGKYDERWLQTLISRYPNILPIDQIEPGLAPPVSVCMELPLPSGCVDNLFVTPEGDIIVGEMKLFRNPEARRKVIAQILEYANGLGSFGYEDLEQAIRKAESPLGNGKRQDASLFEIVSAAAGSEQLSEGHFVDAVSRNLERGRFLLLVIGDGIRTSTERLAKHLQANAGMHFTFALVELAMYHWTEEPDKYLVQPRILARTTNIERAIVTIENERIVSRAAEKHGARAGTRSSLSAEKFYETLAESVPLSVIASLQSFIRRLEELDVTQDFGKTSLILRWRDDELGWNLGSVLTSGRVWTDVINLQADAVGLLDLAHAYQREIAEAIPGAYVKKPPQRTSWYVAKDDTYLKVEDLLAHADAWFNAIQTFTRGAAKALQQSS
jgi:hypothetical protein